MDGNTVWILAALCAAVAAVGAGVAWIFAVQTILTARDLRRELEKGHRRRG
jgi:hypothetical protein